jgi:cytochrome c oxidase cbb3-type subunit 1
MNATSSTSQPVPVSVPARDIDTSCRIPLFVFFVSAAIWLVVSSLFGLIASLKFHNPNFLSDCAWATYGRAHAVSTNALLYGFALQAGLGVALWIIARMGQTRVVQPWLILVGGKLWNLGVTVGLVAILIGDSTGFENFEMPAYAGVFLFLGYLFAAIWTLLTLHERSDRRLEPPQWFLLVALFWFPWIYSTAHLLLTCSPVRGVTQSVIAWWFANNLTFVWMGLVGLAVIFYFVPKFAGRALHSTHLALFAFWTMILFGSWCGIPASAPVPAWISVLSGIASVMTIVTLIAIGLNIFQTKCGARSEDKSNGVCSFIYFGLGMFQLAGLMRVVSGLPGVSAIVDFTWFTSAQWQLSVYGFFAMVMFGAIYYIVPQVTGIEWPSLSSVRFHFWLAAAGTILIGAPLAIGGVMQGIKLNNPAIPFTDITKATLNFLRMETLGEVFLFAGHLLLASNLLRLSVRYYQSNFKPVYEDLTAELKPAEVKS